MTFPREGGYGEQVKQTLGDYRLYQKIVPKLSRIMTAESCVLVCRRRISCTNMRLYEYLTQRRRSPVQNLQHVT